MGWFDDVKHVTKDIGHGIAKGADVATDVIIDKDAWSHTAQAMLDGPGGKEVKGSDLVNMLLDSTMLIPGAGLAGGAARIGVRTAGKMAAKEAAEAAAKRAADKTLLRSPVNNMIRGKADDVGQKLVGKVINSGGRSGARRAEGQVVTRGASGGAKRAGDRATSNQIKRMALKQEKGIGKKVGFGQTKRRMMTNLALTGGANLATRGYDEGLWGPDPDGSGGSDGQGHARTTGGGRGGSGGGLGAPGSMYIVGSDGSQQAVPEGFAAALAAFMEQNGTVDGKQVIYNK